MPYAFISAGSTTRVKDGPGTIDGIWVSPVAGGTLVLADNPDLGASGPNFNNLTAITSTIGIHGVFVAGNPFFLNGYGGRFANALTVAASSSSRVTVHYR